MAKNVLGKISIDLTMGTAEFEQAIEKAKKKTSEFERFFSNYGTKIAAGMGIGAVAAGLTSAISAANDFNAGLANIASLMPGNSAQVEKFGQAIQDLAIKSGKSTQDLTAGMYQVVSAFGGGADAVERLGVVADASNAGLSTTTEALNLLSVTTKAYGDTSVQAMTKASDLAFKTVQLGQTTFPELANSLQNVASEAARVGVSQEELFASFAATTGVIGNASMVSTKFKATLEALSKPSKDMAELYKQLGVESGQALIAQNGLVGALEIIVNTAEKSKMPLGNLIGSIEGQSFAAAIAGNQNTKYKDSLTQMGQAAGTTTAALEEQKNGINELGAKLDQLKSIGEVTLQKIGKAFVATFGEDTNYFIDATIVNLQRLNDILDKIAGNMGPEKQLAALQRELKELKKNLGEEQSFWESLWGSRPEQIREIESKIKELKIEIRQSSSETKKLGATGQDSGKKLNEGFKLAGESAKKAKEEIDKAAKAIEDLKKKYNDTLVNIEKRKVTDAIQTAINNNDWRSLDALGKQLYDQVKEETLAGLDASIRETQAARDWADKLANAVSGDEIKRAYDDIAENIEKNIDDLQKKQIEGAEKLKKIQIDNDKEVAKAKEELMAKVYDKVGETMGLAAKAMETGDWEAFGEEVALQVGEQLAEAFIGPGAGKLVRPAAQLGYQLYDAIFNSWGDPGTEARKNIEGWLEDLLHYNVIFGEDIQANWSDAFAAIAGDGETAFQSLGTAIALLAGESVEYGGQIGFILAQNLNGNLDSARLLVQSLGIDAEQMGQALMDAALKGEMSWQEWAGLQAQVNQLTAQGLVGAGDLTGAWNQFLETGGKGKISLTALQAIAVEATEAGVTSLDQLQAKMRALGLSQEDVDRFIAELRAHGIQNMEDLSNASNETLGTIIAALESAGQKWDNYSEGVQSAIDSMTELEQKLRGIEDKNIDVNVALHYKADGDVPGTATQKALGGVFDGLKEYAAGGVVMAPTYFRYGQNMLGLMGEAGPEAIMPLKRNSKGQLGVLAEGAGSMIFNYSVDARGAGAGVEAAIVQAIKATHAAAVKDSVRAIREAQRRGAM